MSVWSKTQWSILRQPPGPCEKQDQFHTAGAQENGGEGEGKNLEKDWFYPNDQ